MTKEIWGREISGKHLTACEIPGGEVRRQIDYAVINAKFRNKERTAQINKHCHANTNQNQNHHRRVRKMQSCDNAAKKYKAPTPSETGKTLKYDIQELRLHPGKLTNRYQDQGGKMKPRSKKKPENRWSAETPRHNGPDARTN